MANPPPEDQRSRQSGDPALAAAAKRVVALEADINNLRKGMVQQLTVSGKLLKAVFALDADYFGGRFQNTASQRADIDPFRDLSVATQVVEAISEEVQGASAFADSPVLRDGIANLISSLQSARAAAVDMEKTGIEAVGLPVKPDTLKVRSFPENNPPACLTEAYGSVHDLVAMMARTRDRFNAMRMMMNEAERARAEAEDAVTPVNVEKVASAVTEELKSVHKELSTTRAQLLSTIDSHAVTVKSLREQLDAARREAAGHAEARSAERSESRSLAAEIARLVGEGLAPGESDDLEITLAVLREALAEDQDLSALTAATESVVVDWVRLTNARTSRAGGGPDKSAASERAHAEQVAALTAQLEQAKAGLASRERDLQQMKEAAKLHEAAKLQEVAKSRDSQPGSESASRDIGALRNQLLQSTSALRLKEEEARRAKEIQQQELHQHADAVQKLTRQLNSQNERLAVATNELQLARNQATEAARQVNELKEQLTGTNVRAAQSRDVELTRLRSVHEREQAASEAARAQAVEQVRLRESELAQVRSDLAQTTSRLEAAQAEAARAAAEAAQARAARDQEAGKLETVQAQEQIARERQRAQAQAQAVANAERAQAELQRQRQATEAAQAEAVAAQARANANAAEVARLGAALAAAISEKERLASALSASTAQVRSLGGENERAMREGSQWQARLEAQSRAAEAAQAQQDQRRLALETQLSIAQAAQRAAEQELARLHSSADELGKRLASTSEELAARTRERDSVRQAFNDLEGQRAQLHQAASGSASRLDDLERELSVARARVQESEARCTGLNSDLEQGRKAIAALTSARDQAVAALAAATATQEQVIRARDQALSAATSAGQERERLDAYLERLKGDHQALAQRLEEREAQLTARLAEVSRQLGELKQANARLAGEEGRLRAELSSASARATALAEAQRGGLSAQVLQTRVTTLEADLVRERASLVEARAAKESQRRRFEALMQDARDAVERAKKRQEQVDGDDRAIIADLLKQVQELRLRTGSRL